MFTCKLQFSPSNKHIILILEYTDKYSDKYFFWRRNISYKKIPKPINKLNDPQFNDKPHY